MRLVAAAACAAVMAFSSGARASTVKTFYTETVSYFLTYEGFNGGDGYSSGSVTTNTFTNATSYTFAYEYHRDGNDSPDQPDFVSDSGGGDGGSLTVSGDPINGYYASFDTPFASGSGFATPGSQGSGLVFTNAPIPRQPEFPEYISIDVSSFTVTVPLPASLPSFALALVGFGLFSRNSVKRSRR